MQVSPHDDTGAAGGEHRPGDGLRYRRLLDWDRRESTAAAVALLEMEPGATCGLHRHRAVEQAIFVLSGATAVLAREDREARAGTAVFAPAGGWHGLRAGPEGARAIVVDAGVTADAEPDVELPDGPPDQLDDGVRVMEGSADTEAPTHNPALGLFDMSSQVLVSADIGSTRLLIGTTTFAATGAHELHRHPAGDEFVYVLAGRGRNLSEAGETDLDAGGFDYIPRGTWHGFRSAGDGPVRVLFGRLGVGTLKEAGYELR